LLASRAFGGRGGWLKTFWLIHRAGVKVLDAARLMSSCDVLFCQQKLARRSQLQSIILLLMANDHELSVTQDVITGYGSRESHGRFSRNRPLAAVQFVRHRMPANIVT
jgi:hypothetical protein